MPAAFSLESAFRRLAAEPGPIAWLDAGPEATAGASYLVIPAATPEQVTASVAERRAELRRGNELVDAADDVWALLGKHWWVRADDEGQGEGVDADRVRFTGGWLGWFGYETGGTCLELDLPGEPGLSDAAWFRAGAWARLDHVSGEIDLAGADPAAIERLQAAIDVASAVPGAELRSDGSSGRSAAAAPTAAPNAAPTAAPTAAPAETGSRSAAWRDAPDRYADAVREAQRLIYEGEAYQLCLTSRVSGPPLAEPPSETYLRLRRSSPSHHGSFVRICDTTVFGSSPETFIDITPSGTLRSKPIKGTRPRGADAAQDAALKAELESSDKERAENIMIVDLMRNDLGRVAVPGSVRVTDLLAVESYRPVHQLVSTISAQLRPGIHPLEAIASAFPAGSMTGAPKRRAVEHLARIESGPRGIYSGALGYLSENGAVDLAMIIRSVVVTPRGWSIGAGGGITALSEPEAEVAEARLKAAALLAVLEAGAR